MSLRVDERKGRGDRCRSPRYLSNIWYIPPGFGLLIEFVIEIIILRKAPPLCRRYSERRAVQKGQTLVTGAS